ncbi:MAG: hypothetical protein LBP19_02770 [Treponema sp.]|jgi:hypothetical protein|nr:hypothetical protein [Treponema sp.]
MFSFLVERKRIFSLIAACLAALALFSACETDANSDVYYANIVYSDFAGTWKSLYEDSYSIANGTISYNDGGDYGEFDSDFEEAPISGCYQFIVFNAESSNSGSIQTGINDKSGVFIVKFSSDNKYGAVYYRNKTPDSIEMANPYSSNQPTRFDTFEEANLAFVSIDSVGSYVSMWGTYSKQNE